MGLSVHSYPCSAAGTEFEWPYSLTRLTGDTDCSDHWHGSSLYPLISILRDLLIDHSICSFYGEDREQMVELFSYAIDGRAL